MFKTPHKPQLSDGYGSQTIGALKQQDLDLKLSTRRTRKEVLLDEMSLVMPWADLVALISVWILSLD